MPLLRNLRCTGALSLAAAVGAPAGGRSSAAAAAFSATLFRAAVPTGLSFSEPPHLLGRRRSDRRRRRSSSYEWRTAVGTEEAAPQGGSDAACAVSTSASDAADADATTTRKYYEHDGYTLSYLHKPASPSFESHAPLVLVHPVGIGISSWFWSKFLEEWDGAEVYAPDLIGCGLENGSSPWDPDKKGMSFPLGWVEAVETMIRSEVTTAARGESMGRSCVVVTQGGLSPVGIVIAARNPPSSAPGGVSHLVLASPQTWAKMTTPVPESELGTNYSFLRSPILGEIAFAVLESRWAVRLFSDLFLFSDKCDDEWVDRCTSPEATTPQARNPIMVFNAGFLNHRSYEEELKNLVQQPTLVLSGTGDKRVVDRTEYGTKMKLCELRSVEGTNALPWESPGDVCVAVRVFVEETNS